MRFAVFALAIVVILGAAAELEARTRAKGTRAGASAAFVPAVPEGGSAW